jgi:hypothetical protein
MAKVKEPVVLARLHKDGTVSQTYSSLESLALSESGVVVLTALSENWPAFVARLAEPKTQTEPKGGDLE